MVAAAAANKAKRYAGCASTKYWTSVQYRQTIPLTLLGNGTRKGRFATWIGSPLEQFLFRFRGLCLPFTTPLLDARREGRLGSTMFLYTFVEATP